MFLRSHSSISIAWTVMLPALKSPVLLSVRTAVEDKSLLVEKVSVVFSVHTA